MGKKSSGGQMERSLVQVISGMTSKSGEKNGRYIRNKGRKEGEERKK